MLESLAFPGLDELTGLTPGRTVAMTGVNGTLAAVIAALAAREGKKTLLVMDNDLKASRAAEDIRQLTGGECAFLPGGEIDLTRAAGSLENSWRRLEALTAVTADSVSVLCTGAEAMAQRMGRPEPFRKACVTLKAGDVFSPASLAMRLSRMGYERVGMVEGKGQFALRVEEDAGADEQQFQRAGVWVEKEKLPPGSTNGQRDPEQGAQQLQGECARLLHGLRVQAFVEDAQGEEGNAAQRGSDDRQADVGQEIQFPQGLP